VPLSEAEQATRAAAAGAAADGKPSKMALGTEGGFALEAQPSYSLDKAASLVVLQGPETQPLVVPLPCPDLPELVLNVVTAIQVCWLMCQSASWLCRLCGVVWCAQLHPRTPPTLACIALQAHEGASKQEAVAAWEEERRVSK
jgi:hypothetical protein